MIHRRVNWVCTTQNNLKLMKYINIQNAKKKTNKEISLTIAIRNFPLMDKIVERRKQ